jgi:uncharacterized membrane protein
LALKINLDISKIFFKDTFIKFYLFLAVLFWCILISFPVLFKNYSFTLNFTQIIKDALSIVCHQKPERTIYINTIPLLVCSRCTGIYFGGLLSSLINILISREIKIQNRIFYSSSIPIFIDVVLHSAGAYPYSKCVAFITGLLFGSIGFLYIFGSIKLFFNESRI